MFFFNRWSVGRAIFECLGNKVGSRIMMAKNGGICTTPSLSLP